MYSAESTCGSVYAHAYVSGTVKPTRWIEQLVFATCELMINGSTAERVQKLKICLIDQSTWMSNVNYYGSSFTHVCLTCT